MIRRVFLLTVIVCAIASDVRSASAQGRAVQARDGDIVLVPPDATIIVGRSTPGRIRVSSHQGGYLLVVVVDEGSQPDGIADVSHRFQLLQPYLPQYVYDGQGTFEEFETVGPRRAGRSYGIGIPQGRILLASGMAGQSGTPFPEHIVAFAYKSAGSQRGRVTIDEAERAAVQGIGVTASVNMVTSVAGGATQPPPPPDGPVRVGGNVRAPSKVRDVPAVLPENARRAGVQGIVILEITVDAQGSVTDARVLRSIPLLDQAAIDAVRQWQYTPTLLNGRPVPIILTVTVPFSQTPVP